MTTYFQTFHQARTRNQLAFYLALGYFKLFMGLVCFVFTPAMYVPFLQLIHFSLN